MANVPEDYLLYKLARRTAEVWNSQTNGKFTLRLGRRTFDVSPDTDVSDLDECDDPLYSPIEVTEWDLVDADDGKVYLEKKNLAWDFGDGPESSFSTDWYWVEWECDDYPRTPIGAVQFPLPVRFDDTNPRLEFDFRFYFGWFDRKKGITETDDDE